METPLTRNIRPGQEPLDLKGYEAAGGYQGLRKALTMTPKDVQKAVTDAVLRGRGGAGFPTGLKWSFVPLGPDARRPKYFAVNADEMEPGTFKDRLLLEGTIVSSYAIQADVAFIYLRYEYTLAAKRLAKAIAEARQAGYLGKNILGSGWSLDLHLHLSAGRYMCGEESALLNALEGKRPNPRAKPPFPQAVGLHGRPSVVDNVETVANVPHIVTHGPGWFKNLGRSPNDGGTKLYGASGKVKRPGVWELPIGTPIREILEGQAGGMRDGLCFRGLLPGGASTDFLTEQHLDLKMDYDSVAKAGSRLGTGTMIVLDDKTCPVGMVLSLERFFARESCGWCTPCREGLPWAERLLEAIENGQGQPDDLDTLFRLTRIMAPGNTYCALAPGAAEPLQSALKFFREDFERHIAEKRCPWK